MLALRRMARLRSRTSCKLTRSRGSLSVTGENLPWDPILEATCVDAGGVEVDEKPSSADKNGCTSRTRRRRGGGTGGLSLFRVMGGRGGGRAGMIGTAWVVSVRFGKTWRG